MHQTQHSTIKPPVRPTQPTFPPAPDRVLSVMVDNLQRLAFPSLQLAPARPGYHAALCAAGQQASAFKITPAPMPGTAA